MKIPYKQPKKFPLWSKVNTKSSGSKRYHLAQNGVSAVFDENSLLPHANHIEMAGLQCSSIISYKVDENRNLSLYRFVVFPNLRVIPNNTHGSLCYAFPSVDLQINGEIEKVNEVHFDGILQFSSQTKNANLTRCMFVSRDKKALIEEIVIDAHNDSKLKISNACKTKRISSLYLADSKSAELKTCAFFDSKPVDSDSITIKKGRHILYLAYCAEEFSSADIEKEKEKRLSLIDELSGKLKITTPSSFINQEISLAKLRASESIFMTKNGLMHSPGGGGYYAALWTNDQCEYANPLFAYLGYETAQEQSLNCYKLYSSLSSKTKAIYTSIIAQGEDYWHGAGDRGDSSMFVYGFARYLLTTGDRNNAEKYLTALEDACVYIMSKMNSDGVIESDSDELENRFESGKANLSTAVISYDAFISMSYIERELGRQDKADEYLDFAQKIKNGIHSYFEANVEGYETYRYCKEENRLRSWICLPLTVGIFDRLDGTLSALQSDKLKKPCGLLTRSGEKTFWDRSLLYALRGMFYAGKANEALDYLTEYTQERLFGEHCPYPVEAFPEGNAAHLSAESALYVRIFTEGVAGFRPIGFKSFELKPSIPDAWNNFIIENFQYDGKNLTINMSRNDEMIDVSISEISFNKKVNQNEKLIVSL